MLLLLIHTTWNNMSMLKELDNIFRKPNLPRQFCSPSTVSLFYPRTQVCDKFSNVKKIVTTENFIETAVLKDLPVIDNLLNWEFAAKNFSAAQ